MDDPYPMLFLFSFINGRGASIHEEQCTVENVIKVS